MKKRKLCGTCGGRRYVSVLRNYEAHYDGWEEPEYEREGCEDCIDGYEPPRDCRECYGKGHSPYTGEPCVDCHGSGEEPEDVTMERQNSY